MVETSVDEILVRFSMVDEEKKGLAHLFSQMVKYCNKNKLRPLTIEVDDYELRVVARRT